MHVVGCIASITEEDSILILTRPAPDAPDVVSKVRNELYRGAARHAYKYKLGLRDKLLRRVTRKTVDLREHLRRIDKEKDRRGVEAKRMKATSEQSICRGKTVRLVEEGMHISKRGRK